MTSAVLIGCMSKSEAVVLECEEVAELMSHQLKYIATNELQAVIWRCKSLREVSFVGCVKLLFLRDEVNLEVMER